MSPHSHRMEEKLALTEQQKMGRVEGLRKLIQGETDLKGIKTDDVYLERFLCGTNFNVEEAFKKMKSFYDLLLEYPDWFTKEAPVTKKTLIDEHIRILLNDCDIDGRPIYIVKLGNIDVGKMAMLDVIAVDDIWLEYLYNKDPEITGKGLCVIMDMADYSWKLLKWCRPENVKVGVQKILALPFEDFKVHIVNNSFFANALIKLVWPFLPEKLKKMVVFHDSMETLVKYIEPKILPLEYGGSQKVDSSKLYRELFQSNDEVLKSFKTYRSVEKF
ncbi:hypothetical protein JTB14_016191 [Gonioctena quinquepunctata]|nr:hypothetical protein JTB14_016191 [Gonioctena quinquepunctata]